MLKNKVVLEVKVSDRLYQMECYHESPLGEIFDVLSHMRAFIVQKMVDETEKEKETKCLESSFCCSDANCEA